MSDLTDLRDHCRAMATAEHREGCYEVRTDRWGFKFRVDPDPACSGCMVAADRTLFARIADELDAYLTPADDGPGLFGGVD